MRFTIKREQLAKAVNIASRAIPSLTANNLLQNYKMEVSSKGLELTASNGSISIWTYIPFEVNGEIVLKDTTEGSTLVSARLFNDIIRRLESEEVTFEVIDGDYSRLISGKTKFEPRCIDAEEYPDIDLEPAGTPFILPAPTLIELVDDTAFAAASGTRLLYASLRGINLTASNGTLTAIGTDGARLSKKSIPCDPELSLKANIPADALKEIVRMFDGVGEVYFSAGEDRAVFSFGNTVVTTRLISGAFPASPNYSAGSFTRHLDVSSRQLIAALERVSVLLINEKTKVVRLTMDQDSLTVSSSSDANGAATEAIETFEFSGNPLTVAMNCDYMTAAIRVLGSESITISFLGEMKPFVLRNPDDDSILEIITPMKTR